MPEPPLTRKRPRGRPGKSGMADSDESFACMELLRDWRELESISTTLVSSGSVRACPRDRCMQIVLSDLHRAFSAVWERSGKGTLTQKSLVDVVKGVNVEKCHVRWRTGGAGCFTLTFPYQLSHRFGVFRELEADRDQVCSNLHTTIYNALKALQPNTALWM